MGKISEYSEGGSSGNISRYEQGEHGYKGGGGKVGISGKGGGKGGSLRAHHHSAHQSKHDKMAHPTHKAKNKMHGTGNGFHTSDEYEGSARASEGAMSMSENEASCD